MTHWRKRGEPREVDSRGLSIPQEGILGFVPLDGVSFFDIQDLRLDSQFHFLKLTRGIPFLVSFVDVVGVR